MENQNKNFNYNAIPDNQELFIPDGQSLRGIDSVKWIGQAWKLIKSKWVMWILFCIIYTTIIAASLLIPFLTILVYILNPVFIGGIITVCEKQRTTGEFKPGLFFSGFQKNFVSLLGVGALALGIIFLGFILILIISGGSLMAILLAGYGAPNWIFLLILSTFVFIIFFSVTTALIWFIPALIVIHNMKFCTAVSMSLKAVKKNLLPCFLFFITFEGIFIISRFTYGLVLLIAVPLFLASCYSSYRSIFISKAKSSTLIT
ncbi:BPSS1780 family membrane protein [Photorhabdus heterorhabditis]|uniref:DUF2189 domain-containing protein n=1 Tax=Photorhabdus heterorhabditis TaxID=880156 RepID=A0A5B0X126_9GAMM|nr:BPSS1780 family membrane protein [Photorhabdus heterorhabditis]KAA1192982.1 hypothetical protein F0L16_07795 [Photorhabdus heterorhabditis]